MNNTAKTKRIDCLCAGILFVDYICDPIDHLPNAGELVKTNGISIALGGCAANAAADLRKLGVEVGVAGCVGSDAAGSLVREKLVSYGTDATGVIAIDSTLAAKYPSPYGTDVTRSAGTLVVNVQGQDRRFISTPGANDAFCPAMIPDAWLDEAKVFYLGGYLMMPGLESDDFVELLKRLRAKGVKTILDVVLMSSDADHFQRVLKKVLPYADLFMPNDDESKIITGLQEPLDQARWFRDLGANDVCITLGSKGTIFASDRGVLCCGVYPTTFVGGTGSGDAFDAGFIAAILDGKDDADCLRWGSALGASCVRSLTASDSVFTRAELLEFIDRHELDIRSI